MFLSDAERAEIEAMIAEPFITFAEPIVIYKTPTVSYINTNSSYNFAFDERQPGAETTYTPQIFSGSGTIEFLDDRDNQQLGYFAPNQPITIPQGYVRLSISGSGDPRDFLKGSEKIVFDGQNFKLVSDLLHRGMFARPWTDAYLQRIEI